MLSRHCCMCFCFITFGVYINIKKLISDVDMHLLFEKGMKGLNYISKRHSKANNKYLKSYDPKQESKHIL